MKEDKDEQKEFETGPMSVLVHSVKNNTQVGLCTMQRTALTLLTFVFIFLLGTYKLPK